MITREQRTYTSVLTCVHRYVLMYLRTYVRTSVRTYVVVPGVQQGTLTIDTAYNHITHPDDPGIEFEGQELLEADEDDDKWPQTDAAATEKWEALLRNDWRETEASALVPVEPGDDPTAVAAAQDASPRPQSRFPPPHVFSIYVCCCL